MNYPTSENVANWDDASLFAVTGSEAALRAIRSGFDSLNETERVLCCLFELIGQVFNGGFGQWLFNLHPHVIGHTADASAAVGATLSASLVNEVLRPLRNPLSFTAIDTWRDYLDTLSEEQHERFEGYSASFAEIEKDLHRCVYEYTRLRWAEVRAPG
jgi:hypothetical protein